MKMLEKLNWITEIFETNGLLFRWHIRNNAISWDVSKGSDLLWCGRLTHFVHRREIETVFARVEAALGRRLCVSRSE